MRCDYLRFGVVLAVLTATIDVLPAGDWPMYRRDAGRKAFRALSGLGIAKDVIVVTERDLKDFGENPSLVIKPALEEGREVYHAAG